MNAPANVSRDDLVKLASQLTKACEEWDNGDVQRNEVAGKARQILLEVCSPTQFMWTQMANLYTLMSLRTLSQQGVLSAFPADGGITADELSTKTGMQVSLLRRLLRILVVTQFFTQDEQGTYHHTNASRPFCGAAPLQIVLDVLSEHTMFSLGRLPEYLAARKSATEPDDQSFNPYTWSRNQDGTTVWEVMAGNGELDRFQAGLNPANKDVFRPTGFFDFGALAEGDLGDRDVLVDVGGGIGAILTAIIEDTPALQNLSSKCVLQDIAGPIEQANTSGKLPAGVRTMVHNFFKEQPIKGAKAYYLRRILHDYSDAKCVEILSHLAAAAAPDSKILIADVVDPMTNNEGDIPMVCTDITMLNIGGKERSEEQFTAVFAAAGLKLVKVWRGPDDCLIEAAVITK